MTAPADQDATCLGTERWLADQLARFTYKPGWRLTVAPSVTGPDLVVRYDTIDSRAEPFHRAVLRFTVRTPIPLAVVGDDPDLFAMWLLDTLGQVEQHECREWLRRDGEIYSDPHAGAKPYVPTHAAA